MSSNTGKLELLVRRNKGLTEHPYYATELSHLLKVDISPSDILTLEETDRAFSIHRSHSLRSSKDMSFAFRKKWKRDPVSHWLRACLCLAEKLHDDSAILFAGPYDLCGAVKIRAERALTEALPLLEFDLNTVRLESPSSEAGLFLDLFEEDMEWFIELAVWGYWKSLAEDCAG